jgi:hypothetical protein
MTYNLSDTFRINRAGPVSTNSVRTQRCLRPIRKGHAGEPSHPRLGLDAPQGQAQTALHEVRSSPVYFPFFDSSLLLRRPVNKGTVYLRNVSTTVMTVSARDSRESDHSRTEFDQFTVMSMLEHCRIAISMMMMITLTGIIFGSYRHRRRDAYSVYLPPSYS